ncbi:Testis anion transporter 1 [Tupaia chinensis]|uniref:Testis anion transporter 1 n=1 Tax=Tupaia chinensis TaxID=246437 RepID=L9KTI9_TUPCH|nr:Testis anion transporter 1 [Tupaia chinensis]
MQLERSNQTFSSSYRPSSFTYNIKRDVYNEETFQQEHRRKVSTSGNVDIDITTFRHHVQCHCSWHRFLKCMLTVFPFLQWICLYRFKDWLLGDLLAGLSVGLLQVPQGSFFLVSALMINVLKVSPFNSGHLIMGSFIKDDFSAPYFYKAYNRSLSVVATTTFLTGIIQLSMGVLGFGFVATYLPEATVSAYLAGAALHILLSQLTCIFGIMISFHAGPISFFYNIINYCVNLPQANSTSILLFLTTAVALRVNKCIKISLNRYPIEFPMELVLILGFSALANKFSMATENSETLIEMIPYSFLFPTTPDFSILPEVVFQAISLSLVSSFLLIFLGKKIAALHNYNVNSNQDLIAIGLCNVVSSFFRACVFTGAVARTIIQDKSGGRQQFASLVGAGLMLLLMVKVRHFFYGLPNAVLAGIILSNVLPYLETIYNLPSLWRQDQYDWCLWMVTFSSVIFLGLDVGLLVSLVFTFLVITVRSHRTKILLLGQIPNTNIYRSLNDYRELNLVRVPLKEEEIFRLFHSQSDSSYEDESMWRCYCNCDEMEPPPRVTYTERFENKVDPDASSINLVRCSHFENRDTSQSSSEDQIPYVASSTSQRNQEQSYEDVEKTLSKPSGNNSLLSPNSNESQERSRSYNPYSDGSFLPSTHTIILDFSMVHYVDSRATVVLRQVSTGEALEKGRSPSSTPSRPHSHHRLCDC